MQAKPGAAEPFDAVKRRILGRGGARAGYPLAKSQPDVVCAGRRKAFRGGTPSISIGCMCNHVSQRVHPLRGQVVSHR
jgi:hypothetical protein